MHPFWKNPFLAGWLAGGARSYGYLERGIYTHTKEPPRKTSCVSCGNIQNLVWCAKIGVLSLLEGPPPDMQRLKCFCSSPPAAVVSKGSRSIIAIIRRGKLYEMRYNFFNESSG